MPQYLSSPKAQFFDTTTGLPLAGGKVYTYESGTLTPKATYPTPADAVALTNAHTNPIILDTRGETTLVLVGATKLALYTSDGNYIWTVDDVAGTTGDIFDSNGNEAIKIQATNNAVNEITVINAATGNYPKIKSSGGDTNISLGIEAKGSGSIRALSPTSLSSTLAVTGALTQTGAATFNGAVTLNGAVTANGAITITSGQNLTLPGMVMWYAGTSGGGVAPVGWLECNGAAVSRTTYSALFALLGTTFGVGDGSTTFNLPNQARRTLVGRGGSGTATLANTIGSTGGSETHTLVTGEMPAHTHTMTASGVAVESGASRTVLEGVSLQTSSSTGGGGAHNNMQPSLVMMLIIKV